MNEELDKLIIKLFFTIIICLSIFVYRQAHRLFYPSAKEQLFKSFSPTINPSDTLHLFGRILGIGIVYSSLKIKLDSGISLAIFDLFIQCSFGFIFYLLSIYILESVMLFNFDYVDEVQKRKNLCYAVICFSQSIAMALILKVVLAAANSSLIIILFLWLFSMVIIGFSVKSFKWISKISFNKSIIQKDLSLAFSYTGFIFGISFIIISSFSNNIDTIEYFSVQVILNTLKAAIVFPIFRKALSIIFRINDKLPKESAGQGQNTNIGHGIYEGVMFFTACFFTSIIVNRVHFGNFYPALTS